mmetsp:Transcript_13680/g.39225  ORF Transcript_13680/g.39225 Transcript_13680/m.39225 type:complete len:205 (+) Transcript_13680:2488-3102(+)
MALVSFIVRNRETCKSSFEGSTERLIVVGLELSVEVRTDCLGLVRNFRLFDQSFAEGFELLALLEGEARTNLARNTFHNGLARETGAVFLFDLSGELGLVLPRVGDLGRGRRELTGSEGLRRHTKRSQPNQRRSQSVLVLNELHTAIAKTWIDRTVVGTVRISLEDVVAKAQIFDARNAIVFAVALSHGNVPDLGATVLDVLRL